MGDTMNGGSSFSLEFMLESVPKIMAYLPVTLRLAFWAIVLGLALGFLIALARYFDVRVLSQVCQVFVSIVRGTPAMCQLLLVYYGVPLLLRAGGASFTVTFISPVTFAIIALGLNGAGFMSETIRSAMLSVDEGQVEACLSVNMTKWQAVWHVVLPQAFSTALAPLGNTAISMLKDTSLVFNISVVEMMAQARIVGASAFRFFETYVVVSAIYWVCCFVLERLIVVAERRARRHEREVSFS